MVFCKPARFLADVNVIVPHHIHPFVTTMKQARLKRIGAAMLLSLLLLIGSIVSFYLIDAKINTSASGKPSPVFQVIQLSCFPGVAISTFGRQLFGVTIPVLFAYLLWASVTLLRGGIINQLFLRTLGCGMVLTGLAGLAALHSLTLTSWYNVLFGTMTTVIGPGGYLGTTVTAHLDRLFAPIGIVWLLVSVTLAGLALSAERLLLGICRIFAPLILARRTKDRALAISSVNSDNANGANENDQEQEENSIDSGEPDGWNFLQRRRNKAGNRSGNRMTQHASRSTVQRAARDGRPVVIVPSEYRDGDEADFDADWDEGDLMLSTFSNREKAEYFLPPATLLTEPEDYDENENLETVHQQAIALEKAFADFKLQVQVVDIQTGPVISQFELKLAKGLRLNKITALSDDLAIALKVSSVRIVAPIPGKNTVGVELPNEHRQIVLLRDVMEQRPEAAEKMAIPVYLGKDVSGKPMVVDLTKLPHLLIAGRTGTGKSVCLNSIIVSMLMTRGPEQVRMLMIDPKMVELSPYKTIPHLMHPVVTDMRKAEAILGWAVEKMEERYQLLAAAGVRQLSEYNKLSESELRRRMELEDEDEWADVPKKMPYMVIIADEMADLMMTAAKEVETHIIRLAQKSRAVGIHLVLATQKPTVDIITGLIKSNLPARIAFGVATRSDSQVVLDRNGAERLLGNGDMLFLQPGTSQAVRGQGTYVSDAEIEGIIETIGTDDQDFVEELVAIDPDAEEAADSGQKQGTAQKQGNNADDEDSIQRDELYREAVEYVIQANRGSLSLLQRKFSIGYGRAARLIDFMAEDGVVGPYNGSQPREVLMTLSDWKRQQKKGLSKNAVQKQQIVEKITDDDEEFLDEDDEGLERPMENRTAAHRGVTMRSPSRVLIKPPLVKVERKPFSAPSAKPVQPVRSVSAQKTRPSLSRLEDLEPVFFDDDDYVNDDFDENEEDV